MSADPTPLTAGSLARVRQRTWLVEDVVTAPGASPVVSLACVDDDAQGQRLDVLWDAEVDARLLPPGRSALRAGARPDDPRVFAAYLQALRWGCVTSTDPTLFQAPLRAGIVPKTYQLEPLRKALALPRVNLLLADDVGLGKTIEAGLILQELLLRQRVHRVVIAAPASVVLQWRDELSQRFGLGFVIYDKAYVNARRRERGFGVNAWTTHRFFLISHNLLRDEEHLAGLRGWLGDFCPGSLFLLDEAHVASPSSESRYVIDSQTTGAVREVARRCEHRLFLSATPHNGHSSAFSTLLELLDPQRFTRGVPVKDDSVLRPIMVRRLKGELRPHISDPTPLREVVEIRIDGCPADTPELVLAEKLDGYCEILERRLKDADDPARNAGKLVLKGLQKRLLSSIPAFARTLAVHRRGAAASLLAGAGARAAKARLPVAAQAPLFDEDDDLPEAQLAALDDLAVERATRVAAAIEAVADDARARQLLDEMTALAERARGLPDEKIKRLLAWIRDNLCPGGRWGDRRVLLFTEYVDTKEYIVQQLGAALPGVGERLLTLEGGMDEEDRERVKQAFNDPTHPVRILVGTDAAREGINLQACCADLFHIDLPWNPGRMEQRNGRIDRTLQPSPVVRCHYFVYLQRPEDDVLKALVEKTERIRNQLGSLADVLERRMEGALQGGIRRAGAAELARRIAGAEPEEQRAPLVEEEFERARARDHQVMEELRELQRLHQKAADHLEFAPGRLHDVVNTGLRLAALPELSPRAAPPGSYDVPPLDQVAGADPTWREIMDTLRPPRTRKMPEWEWRAKSPPRPITFEPARSLTAPTVQLHLQHKLTQRVLARFRAQAFAEDKLARVTVVLDPTYRRPRVVALGRLSLYGPGASSLHEEVLALAALWTEGDDPARLSPFETSQAEEKAVEALYAVLARPDQPPAPEHLVQQFLRAAPADEEALWGPLQERADRRARWATERLQHRAKTEAEEMARILTAQRAAIQRELAARRAEDERRAAAALQPSLPFGPGWLPEEKEQRVQYDADTRHIEKRLGRIDQELADEPARIRDQYEVKHRRLERVGLVYLWPTTS